ncbi:MAG: hypothetical protein QW098_04920 [Candidatus Hadarchaeales archaeon]
MGSPGLSLYRAHCRFWRRVTGIRGEGLSPSTLEALREAEVEPGEFLAGFLASLLLPFLPLLPLALLSSFPWYLPSLSLCSSLLLGLLFYLYPFHLQGLRRSKAREEAVNTVMVLSFALHSRPDLRGAVLQAAQGEGRLAEDLRRGMVEVERRRYGSTRELLTHLAGKWGRVDEGVRTALFDILRSTGEREEALRLRDLSRAPERLLESREAFLRRELEQLVPLTAAFVIFGSLLIVVGIGLSPLFGMAGMGLGLRFFLPLCLLVLLSFWIFCLYAGGKRPPTLPPPELPPGPKGPLLLLAPLCLFLLLSSPFFLHVWRGWGWGDSLWVIWGAAGALYLHATLSLGPRTRLREEERRKLGDWEVALGTMGSRMLDGKSMGEALRETAELMEGSELSEQLEEVARTQERLGVGVGEALFGRGRQGERIRSSLVRSFLKVIVEVRRTSEQAAGRACMLAGEFLGMLRRVERRFREEMDESLGNLGLMAMLLIPLVCAMSLWATGLLSGVSLLVRERAAGAGLASFPFLPGMVEAGELVLLKLALGLTSLLLSLLLAWYLSLLRTGGEEVEFLLTARRMVLVSALVFTSSYLLLSLVSV